MAINGLNEWEDYNARDSLFVTAYSNFDSFPRNESGQLFYMGILERSRASEVIGILEVQFWHMLTLDRLNIEESIKK